MISVLKKHPNNTADVVSESEVSINDKITIGHTNEGRPIIKEITKIIEQRKERGVYDDEKKRRMWAKVVYNY